MLFINGLVNKNIEKGFNLRDAQNIAAEEIILRKIASSELANHITLKGGIVMFNISKNNRRVTQDIDFDLIRYSIDEKSIKLFFKKLSSVNDGIDVVVQDNIERLHQEDYQGVRVRVVLKDKNKSSLKLKLDIGVHTYTAIEQESIVFYFDSSSDGVSMFVNPPEQLFCEKLLSLARLGALSSRYKDLYDMYYLIHENILKIDKVREILKLFFDNSKRKPDSIIELNNIIHLTLSNSSFIKEASSTRSRLLDVEYADIKNRITGFIEKL